MMYYHPRKVSAALLSTLFGSLCRQDQCAMCCSSRVESQEADDLRTPNHSGLLIPSLVLAPACVGTALGLKPYSMHTMYNVQCTMYNVQCTMYNVQCTMYNVGRVLPYRTNYANADAMMRAYYCSMDKVSLQCIVYLKASLAILFDLWRISASRLAGFMSSHLHYRLAARVVSRIGYDQPPTQLVNHLSC
jgi:hypothetical protein